MEKWYSADSEHLPQNSVKNIFKDQYGFIWIATENGIVRYDGYNFKTFNSKKVKTNSSRIFNFFGFISTDSIFAMTDDIDDFLLINRRDLIKISSDSVNIKNQELFTCSYFKNLNKAGELQIEHTKLFNEKGDFYLIEENQIYLFSKKNVLLKKFEHNFSPENYYFFQENNLVYLDETGNYSIFNYKKEIKGKITLDKNTGIHVNPINKQVFIYSENEISILEFRNNQIRKSVLYTSKTKFDFSIFSLYYEEESRKLFVGTTNKGLCILSKKNFNILSNPDGFDTNYYALEQIDNNTFLTARGELFSVTKFITDLKLNPTRDQQTIAIDHNKDIWLKSSTLLIKFLKKYNYKQHQYYDFDINISTIYYSKNSNTIWVGLKENAHKKYIASINPDKETIAPVFINQINEEINFINEFKENLLLNSSKSLFFYSKKTNKIKRIETLENEIRSTYVSKDNRIWVCTYNNGFSLFENNSFYKIPIDKELFLISSHSIQEDSYGYFWIPTNNGLIQVKESDILNYLKTKKEIYFYHYDKSDGLLTNEFNGGCQPNSIKFENGFIVFPSLNGIISFNSLYTKRLMPLNNFYINEANLDGENYSFNNTITIDRTINRISFQIDFAYLGNHKNVDFETKLVLNDEEENSKWLNLPNDRKLNYTNLPPGNHTLYVKNINGYTSENNIKKILIVVPYYFYEKLWFKLFVIIIISLVLFFLIRLRYNFIKNKNIELEKIVNKRTKELHLSIENLILAKKNLDDKIELQKKLIGTISHDIKSPLKFLTIGINKIAIDIENNNNDDLEKISKSLKKSSVSLLNFVDNLIEYSKIVLDNSIISTDFKNADDILHEIISLYTEIANSKNIELIYTNKSNTPILVNEKLTKIMISNLLDNAIKNTLNGKIEITLKLKSNKIYFTISDTGAGISQKTKDFYMNLFKFPNKSRFSFQENSLGLYMLIEIIHLLDGDFKIENNHPHGTIISFVIDSRTDMS
ncbi:ATP-binding protein [Flavobacterium sp. NRK F10]|uniref:ligand-binding sensor domain-containing protein n=1 Tax=Flavobacterium sp. NRK F10 TaxID=2954931 RepID=UPI002091C784|nr:ATP-binding protein [Flavobacterium sp. NRK F10]MCO6173418.1 ATP-binding protein [Flavobacterium sp. NRK F10]